MTADPLQSAQADIARAIATLHRYALETDIPETGFLRLPEILRHYPVSRSAWWAGIRAGRYPQGVKLGPNTTAWRVEEIRDLIERTSAKAA